MSDGRFLDVFFYPIRTSIGASPKYYLMFVSRHYDAYELWNDEVAREESNLSARQTISIAQKSFLPEFDAVFRYRSRK